eukprot:IDg650t1
MISNSCVSRTTIGAVSKFHFYPFPETGNQSALGRKGNTETLYRRNTAAPKRRMFSALLCPSSLVPHRA